LEQQEKKAKKGSKKLIFNLLYIGLTIGIILGYGLLNPELNGVLNVIGDLSPIWMLIAIALVACVVIFFGVAILAALNELLNMPVTSLLN